MARDAAIEARLVRWAQWVTTGDGSGYAAVSVLHQSWTPPTGGTVPAPKVSAASDVRQTHRALESLSLRQRNTVWVHYVLRLPLTEQARRLECTPGAVCMRIDRIHESLLRVLDAV
mgnify:CR=1 FL=1